ncbi:eotaxin-like [Chanos chanos]|uniref:Eotaxin-like n=1 Tax=Chanos chanos TaxID=29144 RepID=A0A6J2VCD5_CHACN|nr:eotaxin-like [Chanos chanos]
MKPTTLLVQCSVALLVLLLSGPKQTAGVIVVPCCQKTSHTKVELEKLVSYKFQDRPLCALRAVKFTTIKGIVICSDPSTKWAKRAMKYLDEKRKSPLRTTTMATTTTTATATTTTATQENYKSHHSTTDNPALQNTTTIHMLFPNKKPF